MLWIIRILILTILIQARRCPHCDKVYVSVPAFSMHVRTHSQGCKCPYCGKSFSRPWLLQGHIRTHTGKLVNWVGIRIAKLTDCFLLKERSRSPARSVKKLSPTSRICAPTSRLIPIWSRSRASDAAKPSPSSPISTSTKSLRAWKWSPKLVPKTIEEPVRWIDCYLLARIGSRKGNWSSPVYLS